MQNKMECSSCFIEEMTLVGYDILVGVAHLALVVVQALARIFVVFESASGFVFG